MTQEIKDRWLAALRSGTYRQGRGALRRRDRDMSTGFLREEKFCALGVLCDVIDPDRWSLEKVFTVTSCDFVDLGVRHYWGVSGIAGKPGLGVASGLDLGTSSRIMELNDRKKMTFSEIADWIEKNLTDDGRFIRPWDRECRMTAALSVEPVPEEVV